MSDARRYRFELASTIPRRLRDFLETAAFSLGTGISMRSICLNGWASSKRAECCAWDSSITTQRKKWIGCSRRCTSLRRSSIRALRDILKGSQKKDHGIATETDCVDCAGWVGIPRGGGGECYRAGSEACL